jgi:hypothetical protein
MPICCCALAGANRGPSLFQLNCLNSIESRARPPALDAIPHRHTPTLLPLIAGVEIDPIDPMPGCTAR